MSSRLLPGTRCSAYSQLLKPLNGTKTWTGVDHGGDPISISMTERNSKFYFFVHTRDQHTDLPEDEVLVENIIVEAPKHTSTRTLRVVFPEDVEDNHTSAWGIAAEHDAQEFNLKAFFGQRGIVGEDVSSKTESRSPSVDTLYHIDFASPASTAPTPAAQQPAAQQPAAPMEVDAEPTRERAPLFTEMEKLGKIEKEFDLALQQFHATSRDLNNAMLKEDDDTVHDVFDILTVRCSAVGRKHKSMLKAMEEMKAILHTHLVRSDLCLSQYNSYIVCPTAS